MAHTIHTHLNLILGIWKKVETRHKYFYFDFLHLHSQYLVISRENRPLAALYHKSVSSRRRRYAHAYGICALFIVSVYKNHMGEGV